MKRALFRSEVSAAQQVDWLGEVVVLLPISNRIIFNTILAFSILTFLFFLLVPIAKYQTVSGRVAPDTGILNVTSRHSGQIIEKKIVEGQFVQEGEILFVISPKDMYLPENDQSSPLNLANVNIKQVKRKNDLASLDSPNNLAIIKVLIDQDKNKINGLKTEILSLDEEIALQGQKILSKTRQYELSEEAQSHGFISSFALQQKKEELIDQQARLVSLKRNRASLLTALDETMLNIKKNKAQLALTNNLYTRQQIDFDKEISTFNASERITITAPKAGIVTGVMFNVGQFVNNQTLLNILPSEAKYEVHLLLQSQLITHVKISDQVVLNIFGMSNEMDGNITGQISEISKTMVKVDDKAEEGLPAMKPNKQNYGFRAKVKLNFGANDSNRITSILRPGMELDAKILLGKKTLFKWFLDSFKRQNSQA